MSKKTPTKTISKKTDRIPDKLLISAPCWRTRLDHLSHPSAMKMAEDLEPSGPLGIGLPTDALWKGFKHDNGRKDSSIDFLIQVKKKHPEKIVLVQVGDFFETWGLDSVFLVEHCGLNRMGKKGPKAGFPLTHIQTILDRLTCVGFSVVVCEQAEGTTRTGRKSRFIAEIVSPASPIYTHGMAMDKKRWQTEFPELKPTFGLVEQKRGITVVEVFADLKTVNIFEGLTLEAACMRLSRFGGRLGEVYTHTNITPTDFHLENEEIVSVSEYSPREFPQRVVQLVQKNLGRSARTKFIETSMQPNSERNRRPRPLYLATAQQLGLAEERGIPELTRFLLPKSSPATCHALLRNLLLSPPSFKVSKSLKTVLNAISHQEITLPSFIVGNTSRYLKTLQKEECSPDILRDILQISDHFLECQSDEFGLSEVLPEALEVTSHITYLPNEERSLRQSSLAIHKLLEPILSNDDDPACQPEDERVSPHLFEMMEDEFRGRIARTSNIKVLEAYRRVEIAAQKYEERLKKDLIPFVEGSEKAAGKRALSFDLFNRSIWLRGAVPAKEKRRKKLISPRDRYGKEVPARQTTAAVEKALTRYKEAVALARLEVADVLKQTSKKIAKHNHSIVHLSAFSNLMRTLHLHAQESLAKSWSLKHGKNCSSLSVQGFYPYWMKKDESVKNDLDLDRMVLLTGHNMAGKSTALRSLAATTLLASCGLYFPAEEISISEPIDGWYVRTGTQDDPSSGLSAFAVEMNDMRIALRDATANSLVFVDELGKGTESRSGHAIAAGVLERLRDLKVRGLFATHWHEFFTNPEVDLSGIPKRHMCVRNGHPTYRILEGNDLTSAAFDAALQMGLDSELLERARDIYAGVPLTSSFSSALQVSSPANEYQTYSLQKAETIIRSFKSLRDVNIRKLLSKQNPPLKSGSSAVYILRTELGFYYVGETDHLASRLESHRKSLDKVYSDLIYFSVSAGKSQARKIESQLIRKLKSEGFPMLSLQDANHIHFGDNPPADMEDL